MKRPRRDDFLRSLGLEREASIPLGRGGWEAFRRLEVDEATRLLSAMRSMLATVRQMIEETKPHIKAVEYESRRFRETHNAIQTASDNVRSVTQKAFDAYAMARKHEEQINHIMSRFF